MSHDQHPSEKVVYHAFWGSDVFGTLVWIIIGRKGSQDGQTIEHLEMQTRGEKSLYSQHAQTQPPSAPVGSVLPDAAAARCGDPESPALTGSPAQFLSRSGRKRRTDQSSYRIIGRRQRVLYRQLPCNLPPFLTALGLGKLFYLINTI